MRTSDKVYSPTNPDNVKILLTEPAEPYKAIGKVTVLKLNFWGFPRHGDAINKDLRKKGADLGGDAVINLTEDLGYTHGVVIVFTPQQ